MGLDDLKLYCFNITSFTIASFDWLEPMLKITLLLVTIGYTVNKWWAMKKNKDEKQKRLKQDGAGYETRTRAPEGQELA